MPKLSVPGPLVSKVLCCRASGLSRSNVSFAVATIVMPPNVFSPPSISVPLPPLLSIAVKPPLPPIGPDRVNVFSSVSTVPPSVVHHDRREQVEAA